VNIKKIVLIAGGSLLALGVIGSLAGGSKKTPTAQSGSVTTTSQLVLRAAEVPTTAAPTTTTTEAPTTTTEAPTTTTTELAPVVPAQSWVTVARWSADGEAQGPPFTLQGGQQRIAYSCHLGSGNQFDDGVALYVQGPSWTPNSNCTGKGGTNLLYNGAGTYHFQSIGLSGDTFTITIQELR
jgi:hypothetical protein